MFRQLYIHTYIIIVLYEQYLSVTTLLLLILDEIKYVL